MRCHECGAENNPLSRYCHNCDAPLFAQAGDTGGALPNDLRFSDPFIPAAMDEELPGDFLPDDAVGEMSPGPRTASSIERSRHIRVPTAADAQPVGPAAVGSDGRGLVDDRRRKSSPAKRLLFVIVNAAFILGISYLPWASFQYVEGGARLTAPELAMNVLETVSSMLSGSAGATVNTAFAIELLSFGAWGSTIYCSAGDIYYDAVGRRRLHAGIVSAIVVSLVTMGGSFALNASTAGAMDALSALFDPSLASVATLTMWPPTMLGVALLALLADLVIE